MSLALLEKQSKKCSSTLFNEGIKGKQKNGKNSAAQSDAFDNSDFDRLS